MNIYISGSTSFIGRLLINEIKNYHTVYGIDRDPSAAPCESVDLETFLSTSVCPIPNLFIHLASASRVKETDLNSYERILDFNVTKSIQLLAHMYNLGCNNFISLTTNWAYLDVLKEGRKFYNLYAATKFMFDSYLADFSASNGLSSLIFVLYDNFSLVDPRNKIFNLLFNSIMHGKQLKLSPGDQIIDICRMKEIVDAIQYAIANIQTGHHCYSLSGNQVSLKKFATAIASSINKPLNLEFGGLPYRENEIMQPSYPFPEYSFLGNRKIPLLDSIKAELSSI